MVDNEISLDDLLLEVDNIQKVKREVHRLSQLEKSDKIYSREKQVRLDLLAYLDSGDTVFSDMSSEIRHLRTKIATKDQSIESLKTRLSKMEDKLKEATDYNPLPVSGSTSFGSLLKTFIIITIVACCLFWFIGTF